MLESLITYFHSERSTFFIDMTLIVIVSHVTSLKAIKFQNSFQAGLDFSVCLITWICFVLQNVMLNVNKKEEWNVNKKECKQKGGP